METTWTATCPDIECGGCANSIKNALGKLVGVQKVEVDVDTKTVAVAYDSTHISEILLQERLNTLGFPTV